MEVGLDRSRFNAEIRMPAAQPDVSKPKSRRRWSRWKIFGVVVFSIAGVGAMVIGGLFVAFMNHARTSLEEAIAEADRLDPGGWRIENIQAARDRDMIPKQEDAGQRVMIVGAMLPDDFMWSKREVNPKAMTSLELKHALRDLPAPDMLGTDMYCGLVKIIGAHANVIEESRPLAKLSRGRFPVMYESLIFNTKLPHTQKAYSLAVLHHFSSYLHSQKSEIGPALEDCLAIFGVASAIGDEPMAISQLVRTTNNLLATKAIERALGQGFPTDAVLSEVQARTAMESTFPFFLTAARGERASIFNAFGNLADGTITLSAFGGSDEGSTGEEFWHSSVFRHHQAISLRYMTQAVEIARLPPENRKSALEDWSQSLRVAPNSLNPMDRILKKYALILTPDLRSSNLASNECVAMLNVTQVMIAIERFRIAHGRWPESVQEIPTSILSVIPNDPFSGKPVRTLREEFGWIVYSVGPNGQDDQGNLDPRFQPGAEDTDWGYTLYNPENRRSPPPYDQELPSQPFLGESLLDDKHVQMPVTIVDPTP